MRFAAFFLLGLALSPPAAGAPLAQAATGTIAGTVRASAEAVLAGATVTVRNETISLERSATTEDDGSYSVSDLPVQGTYEVRVEFAGLVPVVQSGVSLLANSRVVVDIAMRAATAETLVVTGRVPILQHERPTLQQTVNDTLVHTLPLFGRDFIALASLSAGFTGNPHYPNALGQLYWGTNVLVDGASHYSKWRGAARTFYSGYSLEAIKEVQVLTSQYSPEYGDALASVTNVVTNSGRNEFHGSSLFFVQHGALNDIPAFAPSKPTSGSQRVGFTLGGPVARDRTHFFGSYEGRRQRAQSVVVSPAAFGETTPNNEDEHLGFFRLDHKTTQRHLLTARYNGQWFRWHDEPGGLALPGVGTAVKNDVHTVLVSEATMISDALLNQFRFQFARYTELRTDLQPSVYVARAGYSIEGGVLGPYGFGAEPEDTWEGANTLSYKRAGHSLKAGGGLKYVRAHNQSVPYGWGAYLFGGAPSSFPQPFSFTQGIASSEDAATADPRSLSGFFFAQDDWQVSPMLTVNLGVRYDVESIRHISGFDVPADRNNLQPRVGAAWEPIAGRLVVRGGVGVYNQQHLLFYLNKVQLEGVNGTATMTLAPGSPMMPVFPNLLPASLAGLPPRDIQRVASEFRNPHSVQATVGAEHAVFGMLVGVDVLYLRGRDLMSLVDTNAPASIAKPGSRTVAEADATRPLVPVIGGFRKILSLGNEGESWYRALQVKANRSSGRLQATASYTLSRAEDRANYVLPEDSRNLGAERARADTDVRHNLAVGLTWQVPALRRALNGLSLSGVGTFRSGRPYTMLWGDDRHGTTQNDARPGQRNSLQTSGFRTIDLALARQFRVKQRAIEGRVEAFNVLSTTNFDQYVGALSSPLFSQPVSAFPRRRLQFAAIVRF